MDRTLPAALVITAVFLLAGLTFLPHPITAQTGLSSLHANVCSIDQHVTYIKAPSPGDAGGCGIRLAGAILHLTKSGVGGTTVGAVDQKQTTDAGGNATFSGLNDGTYDLTASRTGYVQANLTVDVQGDTARIVGLDPMAIVVPGVLVDTRGDPVPDATVMVCCGPDVGSTQAVTGGDGSFEAKTQSGERTFTVQDQRGSLSVAEFVDGSQRVHLLLQPGPREDAFVHGTVTDQDGHGLAGALVNSYSYGGCCYAPQPMEGTAPDQATTSDATASDAPSSNGTASSGMAYARPCCCCFGGGSNSTVTDAGGHYRLGIYSGSSVSVSVQKEGYTSLNRYFPVAHGEDHALDLQILKYPAKTARLEGKVVDASGDPLQYVSISAQSPRFGLYECSGGPDDGASGGGTAGSGSAGSGSAGSGTMASSQSPEGANDVASMPAPGPVDNGCAIQVRSDGTFSGLVTPGYTIVQVYYDSYRACPPQDGQYQPCSPEYFGWTQTMTLAANHTTTLTVRMEPRPGPDAVLSGYIVDASTGNAIPGAQISFSNSDTYGSGSATTDKDGSYKVKVRSGHLDVYASADGHLHWAGTLDVKAGPTPFDIQLQPGDEANGGCCYYAGGKVGYAMAADAVAPGAPMTESATHAPSGMAASSAQGSGGNGGSAAGFEDLHGGLGPYDAAARAKALQSASGHASPWPAAALLALALLGCAAWASSRRR